MSCTSPGIEGLLVNYGTTPASVTDFKASIEFECSPKDGSSSQWTIENITWVDTKIPDPDFATPFNLSSCGNFTKWALDFHCDDVTNTPECNFDGGACCGENVDKTFCIDCECKEARTDTNFRKKIQLLWMPEEKSLKFENIGQATFTQFCVPMAPLTFYLL